MVHKVTKDLQTNVWRRIGLILLASALFSLTGVAQVQLQLMNPPKFNLAASIGVASGNPARVFLTSEHDGAWDTFNGTTIVAVNWTFTNLGYGEVHMMRFLAAPSNNNALYMLEVDGNLEYSPMDGSPGSWVSRGVWLASDPANYRGDPWLSFAIDPASHLKVLAGGRDIIRWSDSGGASPPVPPWTDATVTLNGLPISPATLITDIDYVENTSPVVVWAGTSTHPAWSDSNFAQCPPPPSVCRLPLCYGVLRSNNGGRDWVIRNNLPTADANCVNATATIRTAIDGVCPTPANCVYAATKDGLYFTSNGDQANPTWIRRTPSALTDPRITDVFYAPGDGVANPATLYIGTYQGIFKSTNNGLNWTQILPGVFPQNRVNAIGTTRTNSNILYVAYKDGTLRRTTDGGTTGADWAWNATTQRGANSGYPMATVAIKSAANYNDDTIWVGTVCQGGVYQGLYTGGTPPWTWTQPLVSPGTEHDHLHYVMRVVAHPDPAPTNTFPFFSTNEDSVYRFNTAINLWEEKFKPTTNCPPPNQTQICGMHLHGLAIASPPNANIMYVGTGHSGIGFGTHTHQNAIWRTTGGENTWTPITSNFPQPPANTCCHYDAMNPSACRIDISPCVASPPPNPSVHCGCNSLISVKVQPSDPNVIYVGTFGSEQDPGPTNAGRGLGVVKGTSPNGTNWTFTKVNNGLCPDDGPPAPCPGTDPGTANPNALSLNVANVDTYAGYLYAATLNGIYQRDMALSDNAVWTDISPPLNPDGPPPTCTVSGVPLTRDDCRRFEAVTGDHFDLTGNTIYVGTSPQIGGTPRVLKGAYTTQWTWSLMTITDLPPLQWGDRYRVRDMQVGCTRGYVMIEGAGMYSFSTGRTLSDCSGGPLSPLRRAFRR